MFFKKGNKKENNENSKDLPQVLKDHNVRVSTPYGAYPEDVANVVNDLKKKLDLLTTENQKIVELLETAKKERDNIFKEFNELRLQISLMEIPDTSTQEDMQMLGRLSNISEDAFLGVEDSDTGEDALDMSVASDDDIDDLLSNASTEEDGE